MVRGMDWLNYHHLLYFWVVAREGSIAAASKELCLAHPTVSAQIHRLEDALGHKLFERRGRQLVVTEFGRVALRYAEEIFALGREFLETAKGRPAGRPIRFVVGISNALPKSVVYQILQPAFRLREEVRVICREDVSTEKFMGELAMHAVDVVLSDVPAGPGTSVKAFSHLLGECGTSFFAAPKLARSYRKQFPRSLDGAPFLLPGDNSAVRASLEQWFASVGVRPKAVAELDDAALAKVVGEAGRGVFAAADVVGAEVMRRYKVQLVAHVEDVRQRFYAISLERKIKHPAVVAISETARTTIFA